MCSCYRDGKAHTDACRAAHAKYNHDAKGIARRIRATVQAFERDTGVKV